MGYACPVCETPQSDGEHLANHLAFAAILGDADHESWLDEHAPGWNEEGPDELAPRITEYAEEEEYPQVFEDTVHDHGGLEDELQQAGGYGRDATMGADAQRVMAEARQMTEQMLGEGNDAEADRNDAKADDESKDENE
ncbi:hypothetical protein BG842_06730 [Haladaptatus sp. W1]|uniref:DUF5810 domain-containing protein n=1 Tax=Haladaptatus sp. W1 TaxID=1897478 RepID=UPI000849CFA7|nr:DUF5810 domain-containing protein [Haladaptatus sp. W1]ODR79589.1 hypothetical protein BG842_06730 [Haladaptatus sp. W1]